MPLVQLVRSIVGLSTGLCCWLLSRKCGRLGRIIHQDEQLDPWIHGKADYAPTHIFWIYQGPGMDKKVKHQFYSTWAESASWHTPFIGLPFTPTVTCEPGYSVFMSRFDWQVMPEAGWMKGEAWETWSRKGGGLAGCGDVEKNPWKNLTYKVNPRTVLVAPHGLKRLLQLAAERLPEDGSDRTVVFMGTEMPMSRAFGKNLVERQATVAQLKRYFTRIRYMVRDIDLPGVDGAPMGFCWGYTMFYMSSWMSGSIDRQQVAAKFLEWERNLTGSFGIEDDIKAKSRWVLATRGLVASWLEFSGTLLRVKQYAEEGKLYAPSNSSLKAVVDAYNSRKQMRSWAESDAGLVAGVELRLVSSKIWYEELATYRFLLSPMGSAIQTSKTVEALLTLTVPIVQHMGYSLHDELVRMGLPMVVVRSWEEITPKSLREWWETLSPRLVSFKKNCLTVDGWWRLWIGQDKYCS